MEEKNSDGGDNIFSITPMNMKLRLKAGEKYEGVIKVFTPADMEGNFNYKVEIAPYNVVGTDYEADLSTQSNRSKIVDWVTVAEPRGTLGPNETKEIHYTVSVPEDAPGGGQYAVILIGSEEQDSSSASGGNGMNIKNIYQMGSIIYAQVEGETIRAGSIDKNEIAGFVAEMPIKTLVELTNNGNIHETAKIGVKVNNVLSGAKMYPSEGEEGVWEEVIMPETSRVLVKEIKDLPPLGIYEVTQNVDYLGGQSNVTQVVVACPVWFMAMLLAVITLVITGIVFAVKHHRKKKVLV